MAPHLNTRILMMVTSLSFALAGLACLFAAVELAETLGWSGGPSLAVVLHSMVGTLALLKYSLSQGWQWPSGCALVVYVLFAAKSSRPGYHSVANG